MKAVILARGLGSRLSEETSLKPKPMVEIGGRPVLWHILALVSLPFTVGLYTCWKGLLGFRLPTLKPTH
jgi:molybdopterin-guanine dinucleotide biosynthesis protein A